MGTAMRILLVTPLYPPDIADPAPYVKELARRLAKSHTVSVLAFNHLPERVPGVTIHTIEKNRPLPVRLFKMFTAIWKHGRDADVLYVQNGPSTELPATLVTLLLRKPLILRLGDEAALRFADKQFLLRTVQRLAIRKARINIVHSSELHEKISFRCGVDCSRLLERPPEQPEILPFHGRPNAALGDYERTWEAHIKALEKLFTYGN